MAQRTDTPPMNTEAFKDCDIRGTTPDQVNADIFARVGREFGKLVAGEDAEGPPRVVIGGDGRHSTPDLLAAAIRGLAGSPIEIVDLGTCVPTPTIYWAKDHLGTQASAIITASHNPPHWNGLKVMRGTWPPRPEDILFLAEKAGENEALPATSPARRVKVETIVQDYMTAMIKAFGAQSLGALKIVVDPGNGCLSGVASHVFRELGAEVIALHDRIDADFSERNPDCAVPEHLVALVDAVRSEAADFGVAFDGDGDRLAVVDDTGRLLGSERLAMLLFEGAVPLGAQDVVILDNKCSLHLDRAIAAHGATGSEGAASAGAFEALTPAEQDALVAFLDSLGRAEFDHDGDNDVDISDVTAMEACMNGPASAPHSPDDACAISDFDQDGDVDLRDAAALQRAYSGSQ
jgi:phosphomannomutase/phosphoglucomutase